MLHICLTLIYNTYFYLMLFFFPHFSILHSFASPCCITFLYLLLFCAFLPFCALAICSWRFCLLDYFLDDLLCFTSLECYFLRERFTLINFVIFVVILLIFFSVIFRRCRKWSYWSSYVDRQFFYIVIFRLLCWRCCNGICLRNGNFFCCIPSWALLLCK